jgi:tetratricopeptide (TPR) repeat protein
MHLVGHENYPNLVVKSRVFVINNYQELLSDEESAISKLCGDADIAFYHFNRHGALEALDQAISQFQTVVNVMPRDHPTLSIVLNSLGNLLSNRFERLGQLVDLHKGIETLRRAINLTPEADPNKSAYLDNLGHSLRIRFQYLGNLADMDDAIAQNRAALHLIPNGHPIKPGILGNLGLSLQTRFERFGNLADLDDAIAHHQMAARLAPNSHQYKPRILNNLGLSLQIRFQRLGNLADLNDAITQIQAAIHLTPDGHPDKLARLHNLGMSLRSRFDRLGNLADINGSIAQSQAALHLMPDNHPYKPMVLASLGLSLRTRFERIGNSADLDKAIRQKQAAVHLAPDSYPNKTSYLFSLASSLRVRFERDRQFQDCEMAIRYLSAAAMNPVGPPSDRLNAAQLWISILSMANHPSLLKAYKCALELIPRVAWLGLPLVDRHQHLAQIGGITRDAAAAAISLEQYSKALEWLEQGRSIVWTQILQLRTPVDELREVNPDLADRLLRTSRSLEQGGGQSGKSEGDIGSMEEQGRRYRALTIEWESIIKQVRSLPTFKDFLRPPSSQNLRSAARNGPVVVLNIATERCDALTILPGLEEIIHIPLPNLTSKRVVELRDELKDFLYSSGMRSRGERAAIRITGEADEQTCKRVLAELWNSLVYPVLSSLGFSVRASQRHASEFTDGLIPSLIRKYFPTFGGVPLDH